MQFQGGKSRGSRGSRVLANRLVTSVCVFAFLSADVMPAFAQDASQALQQLQQMRGSAAQGGTLTPSVTNQTTIIEPSAPSIPQPVSRLETILSERAGARLQQFGYDQMGSSRAISLPQVGAVQDNYILGPGDEVVVTLRGQENNEYRATVDRDGRVVLPRLSPVAAAGRNFGEFRQDLLNAIKRAYVSTDGFVSVGRLRQISVLVSGEVGSPGVRTLTGLSTPADALWVSGGVKKSGSLRNVKILRGGREINVDLYSVLTGQGRGLPMLADGDRLVVPTLGKTIAISGWVRRPGIYELPAGRSAISAREFLNLAGGTEVRGSYRMSLLHVGGDGRNDMVAIGETGGSVSDGDILFVNPAASESASVATLSGGTPLAGKYAAKGAKLSELLKSPGALGAEPYTLLGVISRRDPVTKMRSLVPFTPVAVLKGVEDMKLQSDDIVRVFTANEARTLFAAIKQFRSRRMAEQENTLNPQLMSSNQFQFGNNSAQQGYANSNDRNNMNGQLSGSANAATGAGQRTQVSDRNIQYSYPNQDAYNQQFFTQDFGAQPFAPEGQLMPNQLDGSSVPNAGTELSQNGMGATSNGILNNNSGMSPSNTANPYSAYSAQQQQQMFPRGYGVTPNNAVPGFSAVPGYAPLVAPGATTGEVRRIVDLATQLRIDPLVLTNFLNDRVVNVDGAVQGPGIYLVGPDADVQSLLAASGGLSRTADRANIEVLSTVVDTAAGRSSTERRVLSLADAGSASYIVAPRDELRVSEVFSAAAIGSVQVQGQVRRTGTYQIYRGEHLSDLLMRAGGLTDIAYPYGSVFLRRSAALKEQDAFRRQAQEIQTQLVMAMSRRDSSSKLSPEAFTSMQSYVNEVRNQKPLGRVSVLADPAALLANPATDPILEPSDVIFIPSRPYSVSVLGEVLQPSSVPFRPDMDAKDYIRAAGGYSQFADSDSTILVLPDGLAKRLDSSWLNFSSDKVPPGSTIYVSRDMSGIDLHQSIVDFTSIVSQLAVTAASLAVLSKN